MLCSERKRGQTCPQQHPVGAVYCSGRKTNPQQDHSGPDSLRFCRAGIRCSSGASTPTLRSSDSLEGFRLRKAVILMVMIYYSESIGVKSSQGKGTWGRVQGRPGGSFHLPFPGESCGQLFFLPILTHMWYCPSRKFTRALVAWVFIEGQVHGVHHVTGTQSPVPLEVKVIRCGPRPPP